LDRGPAPAQLKEEEMNTLKRGNKRSIANSACLFLTFIMSIGLWSPVTAQSFPETIQLPDGFQPEGITLGIGHRAYVGSLAGGAIYEIDLRTGAGEILVPGLGLIAVGLDFDPRNGYLYVAGGLTGDGRVYDTSTGEFVSQLQFVTPFAGWINDVLVTRDAAYFTNSFAPEIFKVPLTLNGEPSGPAQQLPLGGDWVQVPGELMINANGIVATPDGSTLIVVNYVLGLLYTVDPATGFATEIDLGGFSVGSGDGLVLRGQTLYVVQNLANAIAVFTLNPNLSAATFTGYLTDDDLRIPSTADAFGPWLYAVNARFDVCHPATCDPTGLDFDIVRVDR
jgi:hypothetical protein